MWDTYVTGSYWEIWVWGAYVTVLLGNMGVGYLCHRQRGKYGCGVLNVIDKEGNMAVVYLCH